MKRALVCSSLLAALPALAQTNLSMSSWVPPTHSVTKSLVAWGQDIEKATANRVRVTMLPKAPMAPTATLDGVSTGLVDISFVSHGYTPGRFVLTKAAEMPFAGDSTEISSVAYQRVYERTLAKAGEHKGLRVLAVFTHGPGLIATTKKPVASLADLQGMKIRVGGGLPHEIADAMGANTLLKPAPELYELLTGNVVDGTLGPVEMLVSFKLEKVLKHITTFPGGLYNTSFAVIMSEERWTKLAKQDQDAIAGLAGEKLARRIGADWDQSEKKAKELAAANRIQVINASPALVKELTDRMGPLEKKWATEAAGKGVDPAALLAELRAEVKKVAGGQ